MSTSSVPTPGRTPNSSLWVLRFKHHKTTILLYVSPSQPFPSIKADLLTALQKRNLTTLNNHPIPTNPEDVIFGVPVDRNDVAKGWVPLEIPEGMEDEEMSRGNGKKKGKKAGILNDSPAGAGLKDGGMVAFRFRREREREGEKDDGDEEMLEEEGFDVVMPVYEYADEVEAGTEA